MYEDLEDGRERAHRQGRAPHHLCPFLVSSLGFRAQGFRVEGSGFRVEG